MGAQPCQNGKGINLVIMWASGEEHFPGIVSRVTQEISQASGSRDIFKLRLDREQVAPVSGLLHVAELKKSCQVMVDCSL